jgi:hypothetical protein
MVHHRFVDAGKLGVRDGREIECAVDGHDGTGILGSRMGAVEFSDSEFLVLKFYCRHSTA